MIIKKLKEILNKIDDNGEVFIKTSGNNTIYELINATHLGNNLYLAVSNKKTYKELEEILDNLVLEN